MEYNNINDITFKGFTKKIPSIQINKDKQFYVNLSKNMAYALRHKPEKCGLILNKEGYAKIDSLLAYLNSLNKFGVIALKDIIDTIANIDKKRFEILGDSIRAYYGHTCKQKIEKKAAIPPVILYHGTSREAAQKILKEGIKSQTRQYVHMSADTKTAYNVGARKDKKPVLLVIDSQKAAQDGINFYLGNETTWLTDYIPPEYITCQYINTSG